MNSHRVRYATLGAVLALTLGACGEEPPPEPAPPTATAPATPAPAPQAAPPIAKPGTRPGDIARLIRIANEDFAAQRFVSPPTANALEGFLEVRELDLGNGSVREAMVDLYPLATAAVRAAIDAPDLAEAERILALVERGMPDALGVAELRIELDRLKAAEAVPDGGEEVPTGAVVEADPAAAAPGEQIESDAADAAAAAPASDAIAPDLDQQRLP